MDTDCVAFRLLLGNSLFGLFPNSSWCHRLPSWALACIIPRLGIPGAPSGIFGRLRAESVGFWLNRVSASRARLLDLQDAPSRTPGLVEPSHGIPDAASGSSGGSESDLRRALINRVLAEPGFSCRVTTRVFRVVHFRVSLDL